MTCLMERADGLQWTTIRIVALRENYRNVCCSRYDGAACVVGKAALVAKILTALMP